jgi:hypothetical protein
VASFSKLKLSGSTNGRLIKVTATSSPGTVIHTAVSGTIDYDEVWLYAMNQGTTDTALTIEWGGTTDPDDRITTTLLPKAGLTLVVPGLVLQNENNVRAFASTANVILIGGYVNRIQA